MNGILHWLASPEWSHVVVALLHTLWQGALVTVGLWFVLRYATKPTLRYRLSIVALSGIVVSGLITWAILNQTRVAKPPTQAPQQMTVAETQLTSQASEDSRPASTFTGPEEVAPSPAPLHRWTAWMALIWLAGAAFMLARASAQVAGAGRMRRSCEPLTEGPVVTLLHETQKALLMAQRVRLAVTEKLTSPAVVGCLLPTLILPLTLVTAMSPEQLRFILLHELAHIRRGDYLANLFQLLVESLLFFNPAVWWISRQIRLEREACCDALAIELSGAPAAYARTLVTVAESALQSTPAPMPAFGQPDHSSHLAERVRRLLMPEHRPALRLTWRALLAALFVGGVCLFISALGTRWTVNAAASLLTPQQRIARIEKHMEEYGQKPVPSYDEDQVAARVPVSGRVVTSDGSPLPQHNWVMILSRSAQNSSMYSAAYGTNGAFHYQVRPGTIWVFGELTNFAPAALEPIDASATNSVTNLVLTFSPGFDVTLQAVDADTGKPIPNARLHTRFWPRGANTTSFDTRDLTTDREGVATLTHASDLPLDVTLTSPDYVIVQQRIATLQAGKTYRITARRGAALAGVVLDKTSSRPIADAAIRSLYEEGPANSGRHGWDDPHYLLGTTSDDGRFAIHRLRRDTRYSIGIAAPDHESVQLEGIFGGQSNLVVRLGPELVVHGRITGNLNLLKENSRSGKRYVQRTFNDSVAGESWYHGTLHEVRIKDGVGYFEFTNRVAGPVSLLVAGHTFRREVDAPIEDWHIDLSNAVESNSPPQMREVVFRFTHSSGVPPQGTVRVEVPQDVEPGQLSATLKKVEVQNGEVRLKMPVGGHTGIGPDRTVGYWFKEDLAGYLVTNGTGPMVIDIPVIPAGAIYARAFNADGSPAAGLLFTVDELKRSPLLKEAPGRFDDGDSFTSGEGPRRYVSGPLPLGGTYQVIGWRGCAFCASEPIKLTEEKPDREVELHFVAGRNIEGHVLGNDGKPIRGAEVKCEFAMETHSFGLKSTYTDESGYFQFENATPDLGRYSLEILNCPGWRSERVPVDLDHLPLTVKLKPGLKLTGKLVEAGSGWAIPAAKIRVWTSQSDLPDITTHADSEGQFAFNSLGEAKYHIYVEGGTVKGDREVELKGSGRTDLTIEVTPWQASHLKPKRP